MTHSGNKLLFVALFALIISFHVIDALSKGNSSDHHEKKGIPRKAPSKLKALLLITYILVVIFAGIFIYYFFMCYPILCRKERNYDVVEHSRDTTPTPNIEKST